MKKRILVIALAAALLAGCGTQEAASAGKTSVPDAAVQTVRETDTPSIPQAGEVVNGFETMETRDFPAMNASVVRFVHQKTGAELYYIANDDTNRIFDLTFRTESPDDTGIPHVFEHAITDGSEKYPSRQLYYNLQYQTYNTYMNATTFDRCTTYPVGSMSEAQLLKLAGLSPTDTSAPADFSRRSTARRMSGCVVTACSGVRSVRRFGFTSTRFPRTASAQSNPLSSRMRLMAASDSAL